MNIYQTFVSSHLKLFARVFVFVHGAEDCNYLFFGGQWDWPGDSGTGALCGLDDLRYRLIYKFVIIAFEIDSDDLVLHEVPPFCGYTQPGVSWFWAQRRLASEFVRTSEIISYILREVKGAARKTKYAKICTTTQGRIHLAPAWDYANYLIAQPGPHHASGIGKAPIL